MSGRHPFSELTKEFSVSRRRRVEDMKLKIVAEFPHGEVTITNFSQLGEAEGTPES